MNKKRRRKKEHVLRRFKYKTKNKQGKSLFLKDNVLLRMKLNFDIYIKSFLSFQQKHNSSYLLKLQKVLKGFKNNFNQKRRFIYILRPVKGGYTAYSSGAIGFLPKSQATRLFKKTQKLIGLSWISYKNELDNTLSISSNSNLVQKRNPKNKKDRLLKVLKFSKSKINKRNFNKTTSRLAINRRLTRFNTPEYPTSTFCVITTGLSIRIGFKKRNFVKSKKRFRKRHKKTKMQITFIFKKI